MVTATFAGEKTLTSSQASPLDEQTENWARYVIKIAGCNDCHTTGYAEAAGKIPEKDWLTGGFRIDNEWGKVLAPRHIKNLTAMHRRISDDFLTPASVQ
ncbi:MAG: hypothetical protein P0119_22040 [Nitrospira sp.]|nr:hypothetical protein [Nitrospira sp.]